MDKILQRFDKWSNDIEALTPVDPSYYSSYIFLTNAFLTYYYKKDIYCLLFTFLFITSILYRIYYLDILFYIDNLAIIFIVLYGSHLLYMKYKQMSIIRISCIVITFLSAGFLFYYGYLTKQFCYDPAPITGKYYNSLLHIISSIGHHLITV
jgi:hypothetical protein